MSHLVVIVVVIIILVVAASAIVVLMSSFSMVKVLPLLAIAVLTWVIASVILIILIATSLVLHVVLFLAASSLVLLPLIVVAHILAVVAHVHLRLIVVLVIVLIIVLASLNVIRVVPLVLIRDVSLTLAALHWIGIASFVVLIHLLVRWLRPSFRIALAGRLSALVLLIGLHFITFNFELLNCENLPSINKI